MRKLEANEYSEVLRFKEFESTNGDYVLVNSEMEVKSLAIYSVRGEAMYDDITYDVSGCEYDIIDREYLRDMAEEEHLKFAKLTNTFDFPY